MNTEVLKQILKWEVKAILIIWIVNLSFIVISTIILTDFRFNSNAILSKLTFVETGIILLVGGIISFLGSVSASKNKEFISKTEEHWTIDILRSREKQANKYLILSALLFVQSIIISFIGF
jgi:hypothetical protein